MAKLENVHIGIIGLIMLVGGAAVMETKGALEGFGFLMMIVGVIMLIFAWNGRSK